MRIDQQNTRLWLVDGEPARGSQAGEAGANNRIVGHLAASEAGGLLGRRQRGIPAATLVIVGQVHFA
ncbi:hypothetical protein D9M68_330700 [compost metagenome]